MQLLLPASFHLLTTLHSPHGLPGSSGSQTSPPSFQSSLVKNLDSYGGLQSPPPPPPWACATHAAASLPFLSTTQPPVLLDYSSLPTPRGLCTAVPSASDRHLPASFRAFVPQPKCRPSARKASLTSLTSFHPTVLLHFPLSGIVLSTYLPGFSSLSFYHCTLPSASTS